MFYGGNEEDIPISGSQPNWETSMASPFSSTTSLDAVLAESSVVLSKLSTPPILAHAFS